ncbi:PTS-dependent dihydroxyacetone kinase phosphotransferase subunit DhaM [Alicyclobacillus herbarius]|uniref:PTS-dependent dihydroxyacetone kinase phosphotransferase subunit DhaM n=1 Tax=Alicyclobacillus herbarius TaxID=122960 RepID=UPI00235800B0|nr:dihydroxyacetone kinase [Alicyclobacillus herbarius]
MAQLLHQFTGGKVHIGVAAGIDGDLGTDATEILRQIEACPQGADVVLLFDLGSAKLNCEMALELLPPDSGRRVSIADAPLVEGAIAAAMEASLGGNQESVLAAATAAWQMRKLESP